MLFVVLTRKNMMTIQNKHTVYQNFFFIFIPNISSILNTETFNTNNPVYLFLRWQKVKVTSPLSLIKHKTMKTRAGMQNSRYALDESQSRLRNPIGRKQLDVATQ